MVTLSEAIERLYAHDELAAEAFKTMSQEMEEENAWIEDSDLIRRREERLLTDVITILGAYEDVEGPAVSE